MQLEMYTPSDADRFAALRREIGKQFRAGSIDQLGEIFDHLTPEEAKAWRLVYAKCWPHNNGSWSKFPTGELPLQIRRAIPEFVGLFHNLEIWEPSRDGSGFLLVGVIYRSASDLATAEHFMIARWAKDELWLSLDEQRADIVEIAQARERQAEREHRRRVKLGSILLGVVSFAIVLAILLLLLH